MTKLLNTPWGKSQGNREYADGIVKVHTASHGGFWISQARRDSMPDQYRNMPTFAGGNWYEEDCDWALVALSFPQYFDAQSIEAACDTLKWLRANSERFAA